MSDAQTTATHERDGEATITFTSLPQELQIEITGICSRLLSRQLLHAYDESTRALAISSSVPSIAALKARLALSRTSLESLTLRGVQITDNKTIDWIVGTLPLKHLHIHACEGLTPEILPSLRAAFSDGCWSTNACFWAPSPLLSHQQVLAHQILSLRMNNLDGIAKCFAFASPANRAMTGPLSRFAAMIRAVYSILLSSPRAHVAELARRPARHDHAGDGGRGGGEDEDHEDYVDDDDESPNASHSRASYQVLF